MKRAQNLVRGKAAMGTAAVMLGIGLVDAARADIYCASLLNSTLTYADGHVMVQPAFRNDWIVICSLYGTWKGVPAEICMSWNALITSARIHQKPVGFYYSGIDIPCGSIAIYLNAPAPIYVRLAETP